MSHVGSDTMAYVRGLSLQQGTCHAHTSGLQSNIRGPLRVPYTLFIRPHRGPEPYDAGQRKKKTERPFPFRAGTSHDPFKAAWKLHAQRS